jgi:hypothetical protein
MALPGEGSPVTGPPGGPTRPVRLPTALPRGTGGLIVAPLAAEAVHRARLGADLRPEDLAAATGITAAQVLEIEAGFARTFDGAPDLLSALGRVASRLRLPHDSLVDATLQAWSSNYAEQAAQAEPTGPDAALSDTAEVTVPDPGRVPGERSPLTVTLWVAGAALVVLVVALLLTTTGIIGHHAADTPTTTSPATRPTAPAPASSSFLRAGSTSATAAGYAVAGTSYSVTVSTTGRSWVEIGPPSGPAKIAQILQAGGTVSLRATGPLAVQIGAGGTSVVVSAGGHHRTLTPAHAPFTYNFTLNPAG